MKSLHGDDGINEAGWDRAMSRPIQAGPRKPRRPAAARQPIPTITEEVAMHQPRELPPIAVSTSDIDRLIKPRPARAVNVELLDKWLDLTAALRCSPPLFESDEPGAREALIAWAERRGFRWEDEALDIIGGRHNMVTRVHTHHHHHIDVLWTSPTGRAA